MIKNRQKELMHRLLNDGNWEEVFKYTQSPDVVLGDNCSNNGFDRTDVKKVLAMDDGDNDGPDWVGVFYLKDKRWACVRAGCDYTGWGCQEDGSSNISSSLKKLVQFGLSSDERKRLNLVTGSDAAEEILI